MGYSSALNNFVRSDSFDIWLAELADQKVKARILARFVSARLGNFGDCAPVGEGVAEMRIHVGAGYRVYFVRTELVVCVLLVGGDKSSRAKNIARARQLACALKET